MAPSTLTVKRYPLNIFPSSVVCTISNEASYGPFPAPDKMQLYVMSTFSGVFPHNAENPLFSAMM